MTTEITFTPDESAALEPILKAASERARKSISVEQLLFKWERFVRQVESGYDDSIYEYTNDLSSRDVLEEIVAQSPPSVREKLQQALQTADEAFKQASRASERPVSAKSNDQAWWWFRIPLKLESELEGDLRSEGLLA